MTAERHALYTDAGRRRLRVVAGLGAVTLLCGLVVSPPTAWAAWLGASFYFLTLALAGAAFLALLYATHAGWGVVIKRIPEAMAAFLPIGAGAMLLTLFGLSWLYPWARPEAAHDHHLHAKHAWLNAPFFATRMLIVLALWSLFAALLRRNSRLQDTDGAIARTEANVMLSAAFLILLGWTFTMASFDWLMSLEPRWFSTVFGLHNISGLLSAGVAAIVVILVGLRRHGFLGEATTEHLHDLGKLAFGFSTFWAYTWLSQYLLIWYANIPEETAWYLLRTRQGWSLPFWANLALNWVIPFALLLPRAGKRSETNLLYACGVLLAGRWLDIYLMTTPAGATRHPGVGLMDVAAFATLAALFALTVDRAMRAAPLVPRGDPYLVESLHHEA